MLSKFLTITKDFSIKGSSLLEQCMFENSHKNDSRCFQREFKFR